MELGGVGEAERRTINQAVQTDESQRDGDAAPQTAPAVTEGRDVGDDAEKRFRRPERKNEKKVRRCSVGTITKTCRSLRS